jgi:hypothetical protein
MRNTIEKVKRAMKMKKKDDKYIMTVVLEPFAIYRRFPEPVILFNPGDPNDN